MRGVAAVALALLLAAAAPLGAQETPRVVRQLRFDGNSALSSEVLASAIATTNSSWFARVIPFRWLGLGEKRYFDEQEFKRDVVRLQVLYRRSGYPHAEMDTVVRREPANVYITLKIREGEPIRVTSLTVTGLDTLPEKLRRETLVDLPIQAGDPFNRFIMQATADTITRRLKDRGRPAARVFTSFETNTGRRDGDPHLRRRAGEGHGHRHGQRDRRQPDRAAGRSQPAHLAAGPHVLAGRAVPEPAQPLLLRPVPLRHRQHRQRGVQPGGRLGAARGAGERSQAPSRARRPRLRHG